MWNFAKQQKKGFFWSRFPDLKRIVLLLIVFLLSACQSGTRLADENPTYQYIPVGATLELKHDVIVCLGDVFFIEIALLGEREDFLVDDVFR